ncbi:MAG: AMP-binding protein, partial [Candidatus Delongbacteria bacterium]|nr:AMP-binding protein [Candidatus Delongbacteria bacterium]
MIPERTFDLLERNLKLFGHADALAEKIDGKWIKYSFEAYYNLSRYFALGLIELGFVKNDKISTITNNRPEWNFVDMGMAMIGVVHVPVYTSLNADEYKYVFEHSDSKMVIVADKKFFE